MTQKKLKFNSNDSVAQNISKLLNSEKHAHLRDDDRALITNIWCIQLGIGKSNIEQMNMKIFFDKFTQGELANPETIRRIRQEMQEKIPQLRGKKYEERHKKAAEISDKFRSGK